MFVLRPLNIPSTPSGVGHGVGHQSGVKRSACVLREYRPPYRGRNHGLLHLSSRIPTPASHPRTHCAQSRCETFDKFAIAPAMQSVHIQVANVPLRAARGGPRPQPATLSLRSTLPGLAICRKQQHACRRPIGRCAAEQPGSGGSSPGSSEVQVAAQEQQQLSGEDAAVFSFADQSARSWGIFAVSLAACCTTSPTTGAVLSSCLLISCAG